MLPFGIHPKEAMKCILSVKVLHLIEKEKLTHAEVSKILGENKSLLCETMKAKRKIHASFAVIPQTTNITDTTHNKCLVIH